MNTYEFIVDMTKLLLKSKKQDKELITDIIELTKKKQLDLLQEDRLKQLEDRVSKLSLNFVVKN